MKHIAGLILTALFCIGCGQKGALYFPEPQADEPEQELNQEHIND